MKIQHNYSVDRINEYGTSISVDDRREGNLPGTIQFIVDFPLLSEKSSKSLYKKSLKIALINKCSEVAINYLYPKRYISRKSFDLASKIPNGYNEKIIVETFLSSKITVLATGRKVDMNDINTIVKIMKENNITPMCLGRTTDNFPKHPCSLSIHYIPIVY